MSNPTKNYNWKLPLQYDDPWFRGVHEAVQYMDTTMFTVDTTL